VKIVYEERWDSPEAQILRDELEAHFGPDDLKMSELALHIDNIKWERSL
jgi:hypothetical protein